MTDFVAGFFAPWIIYALMLLLHLVLPARKVDGYVTDESTGKLLKYRLNGPLVLLVVVALWVVVGATGVLGWDWLYTHRWSGLIGSCVLGVLFSLALVLSAPPTGRSLARRPLLRALAEPAVLRRARGCQDVLVSHRGGHAGPQPACLHGASRAQLSLGPTRRG